MSPKLASFQGRSSWEDSCFDLKAWSCTWSPRPSSWWPYPPLRESHVGEKIRKRTSYIRPRLPTRCLPSFVLNTSLLSMSAFWRLEFMFLIWWDGGVVNLFFLWWKCALRKLEWRAMRCQIIQSRTAYINRAVFHVSNCTCLFWSEWKIGEACSRCGVYLKGRQSYITFHHLCRPKLPFTDQV